MKRKLITKILEREGYSDNTIKKIFQLKTRPSLLRANKMEREQGLSTLVWDDVRKYLSKDEEIEVEKLDIKDEQEVKIFS